jgi:hypothetical protein
MLSLQVGLAAENIRLVCEGRVFEDNFNLAHYNPTENSAIHCLENRAAATVPSAAQVLAQKGAQTVQVVDLHYYVFEKSLAEGCVSCTPLVLPQATQEEQMMQNLMNNPMMERIMSSERGATLL